MLKGKALQFISYDTKLGGFTADDSKTSEINFHANRQGIKNEGEKFLTANFREMVKHKINSKIEKIVLSEAGRYPCSSLESRAENEFFILEAKNIFFLLDT